MAAILSNGMLLELWERGRGASAVERALLLLGAADPTLAEGARADCSLARRDADVLALRCRALGPRLQGLAACPCCAEQLEFEVDAASLLAASAGSAEDAVSVGGLRFRLPCSRDLLATSSIADEAQAAREVLRRCCLDPVAGQSWPDELAEQVEQGLAERAGVADARMHLECAACSHAWEAPFDACAYVWEEFDRRAQILLDDVHRLALCYGWDEQRILALSDARRSAYLARCEA